MTLPVLAGTVSTAVFAASMLPMLVKAAKTRDLSSYSPGNLVLANAGNVVHSVYVVHLPVGPIWFLHGFYLATSALMLFGWLRFHPHPGRGGRDARPAAATACRCFSRGGRSGSPGCRIGTWNCHHSAFALLRAPFAPPKGSSSATPGPMKAWSRLR